jgi:hypothetical protein
MRIWYHYRRLDLGRRIALRVLITFLLTFAVLRAITAIIHYELFPHGPFRNLVTASGLHIHHLFWGILPLMLTGFVALATRAELWRLRISIIFGIALGLTLDEFALCLRLADVYWSPEGIESLKAGAVVAALLGLIRFRSTVLACDPPGSVPSPTMTRSANLHRPNPDGENPVGKCAGLLVGLRQRDFHDLVRLHAQRGSEPTG